MATQKKGSYKKYVFAVAVVLASAVNTFGEEAVPLQVLKESYQDMPASDTAESTIAKLNQVVGLCVDNMLKYRIKYRIGILYFKSCDLTQAVHYFDELAQSEDCPDLIRLCSFTMAGQIYRMQAKDNKALNAFEKLIIQSQKYAVDETSQNRNATISMLVVSARFGRAEINQYNKDYDAAIAEYKYIHTYLKPNKVHDPHNYAPLALDRMSQLYLMLNNISEYNRTALELINDNPDYHRIPMIRLETESVNILKDVNHSEIFSSGSYDAPVRLIALVKKTDDEILINRVTILFQNLCKQYHNTTGGRLLDYHYAWLLDSTGKSEQSISILQGICKRVELKNTDTHLAPVMKMITAYAKLQEAIILGEKSRYDEALEAGCMSSFDMTDAHLSRLADSINKSLTTLKREIP